MNKTESRKRLRSALAAAREYGVDAPKNARVEIGLRAIPVFADTQPERTSPEGDDLWDFDIIDSKNPDPQVLTEGYVVHFFFYSTVELCDTLVVWTGTDTEGPVVLGH